MRSLLDTHLLVYADSSDEARKQRCAIDLIKQQAVLCQPQLLQNLFFKHFAWRDRQHRPQGPFLQWQSTT